MMDVFFGFLLTMLPFLHLLAGIVLFTKALIVFKRRGVNLPALILSFFRIYTKVEMGTSVSRYQYMKMNNLINYYLYTWTIITIVMLIVAGTFY